MVSTSSTQSQPQLQPQPQPQAQAQPQPQARPQLQPQAQPQLQPQAPLQLQPQPQPAALPLAANVPTWQERVKEVIGPRGYENTMRRSLQTVILFEAKRVVAPRLNSLRPFQRKVALLEQAKALLDSLDFVFPHQKEEIFWRTMTSKEELKADTAWKRMKLIDKELARLCVEIKPFLQPGRSHQEAVDMFVLDAYNKANVEADKALPSHWEYAHNHVIMAFRVYYNGDQLDQNSPTPSPYRNIVIPSKKENFVGNRFMPSMAVKHEAGTSIMPVNYSAQPMIRHQPNNPPMHVNVNTFHHHGHLHATLPTAISSAATSSNTTAIVTAHPATAYNRHRLHHQPVSVGHAEESDHMDSTALQLTEGAAKLACPAAERRRILQEVREHLDLLKEFEGIISNEDLTKRKQELFAALPPAPPPAATIISVTASIGDGRSMSPNNDELPATKKVKVSEKK